MRIAVLADIHGNIRALRAVLADLEAMRPDLVINLGDCASGPLEAGETVDLLMGFGWPTIRGNHDRQLLDRPVAEMIPSDAAAWRQLGESSLAWLAALPATAEVEGLLLCHGTPASDDTYLLETVTPSDVVLSSPADISERLGPAPADMILCGHSHTPRLVRLPDGRTIVNPGSVGLQAYDDATPLPHVVETGSPHARYVILDRTGGAWRPTFRTLAYDWDGAARTAAAAGRPDWARALATGFAPR